MLTFEQFKHRLITDADGPDWLNAYVDQNNNYWIQANGGMGTSIFEKLEHAHPFVSYLETLLQQRLIEQQSFKREYEAGDETLAHLLPQLKDE